MSAEQKNLNLTQSSDKDNQSASNKSVISNNLIENDDEHNVYNMATQIIPTSSMSVEYSYTNNKENEVVDFDAPAQTFVSPKDVAEAENNRNGAQAEEDIYMRETQVNSLNSKTSKFKV